MKILNFGSCNIDYVYSMDHVVRVGETQSTSRMDVFCGGKGLNQSIAIARAGAEVYHAGCVGTDGETLRELLLGSGVNLSYLRTVDAKNGHAIIQVSAKGDNSIFIYGGSNEMVSESFIDEVLDNFDKGDILLLQNEISNVGYIVDRAKEKEMCIILNPSPFNEKIKKIDFNKISYLILNEVEAKEISACTEPEEALAFLNKAYPSLKIILTLGESGSVYSDAEYLIRQSAFKSNVVDTTAAGDAFTGYFVAGLSYGADCKATLKLASAAAAIAVSRNGAAPSIPYKDEVLAGFGFLKESGTNKSWHLKKKIETYIEEHLKDASLESLSRLLNYSVIYTGTLVKKLTGKSFSVLLQDKRCSVAARMLLHTDMPIKAVINSVGYENESFFREIFKKKYGSTPLNFRKRMENGYDE